MAQHRQPAGSFRNAHVSLGIRTHSHKQPRTRRFRTPRISLTALLFVVFAIIFLVSAFSFLFLSKDKDDYRARNDESGSDLHFLANVTHTERSKVLKFGHGSFGHGGDSRYWDRDDRRRDEDYSEDSMDHSKMGNKGGSVVNFRIPFKRQHKVNKISEESKKRLDHGAAGLYNEAGRNELKMYEAAYEATLKGAALSTSEAMNAFQRPDRMDKQKHQEDGDAFDEYEDEIDMHDNDDIRLEDYNTELEKGNRSGVGISHGLDGRRSSVKDHGTGEIEETVSGLSGNVSLDPLVSDKVETASRHVEVIDDRSTYERKIASKKRSKRRKFSGSCEMKILNSTTLLVEPLEIRKFARFSLQYVELEEKPNKLEEPWEPRFAGHQSLVQREQSFIAHDQEIHCGFVKGPRGAPSTGFDLDEDDEKFLRSCHIAVVSCIFGNSDRLRSPMGKTVSRLSRKNVCFVMFVDGVTLQTLSSEGHITDKTGYIGLWKTVLVKNLPYTDMRRVGKIPKLLSHRLFPSARYSIWLDSKLRLQLDPLLVLEYLLWRKGHEYAISNHYDRHCVWEEVAQNKKLNKYNHTVIDEQFAFYQADGLTRFNPMDPQKLLPSDVPEGSFIVRAHTPMSNLFSCLWFNEVQRFTPRDQLSFAYTYHKLRRMNPSKPFYFNMFKDCERRKMAKLFRHRSEERRYTVG